MLNSKLFLWILFKNFNIKLDFKENNFLKFINTNNNILNNLEEATSNIIFNEILMSIFEIYINKFFLDIKKFQTLCNGIPELYLEKCFSIIMNKNNIPFKNLQTIYSITYIKLFFIKFIDFLYNLKEKADLSKINNLFNKYCHLYECINIIQIYILKCFRFHVKYYNELQSINYKN